MMRQFHLCVVICFISFGCSGNACTGSSEVTPLNVRGDTKENAVDETPSTPTAHSSVAFDITCAKGIERYISYKREWTENFDIERRVGDNWESFEYQPPFFVYHYRCPQCNAESPPAPWPRVKRLDTLRLDWHGLVYTVVDREPKHCFCYNESAAPPGEYRAVLRLYPSKSCDDEACAPNDHGEIDGVGAGEPVVVTAEFVLTDVDQTVHLVCR